MRSNQLVPAVESVRSHRGPVQAVEPAAQLAAARHLASGVNRIVSRLPMDSRCLVRALTLSRCLARRGIASTLVVGVAVEPAFSAHAWVEMEGRPLLPPGDERMKRLVEV